MPPQKKYKNPLSLPTELHIEKQNLRNNDRLRVVKKGWQNMKKTYVRYM